MNNNLNAKPSNESGKLNAEYVIYINEIEQGIENLIKEFQLREEEHLRTASALKKHDSKDSLEYWRGKASESLFAAEKLQSFLEEKF